MAQYHVMLAEDGSIIAGTVTKTGKASKYSDVTEEAFAAVRDHLLNRMRKENKGIAYGWQFNNGKTLLLKLEEQNSEDIKE